MRKSTLFLIAGAVLAAGLCAAGLLMGRMPFQQKPSKDANTTSQQFLTEPTEKPTRAATEPTQETQPGQTAQATEAEATEAAVEAVSGYDAAANTFTLSFVGDCTLGSDSRVYGNKYSFIDVVGEDYAYPLRNVASYFEADDCTIANLEAVLKDEGVVIKEGGFAFRGPTAYTNILTLGGVDAVTIANNHIRDFGVNGIESTRNALNEAGIPFAEQDSYTVFTTERGLKIGMYGGFFQMDVKKVEAAVKEMKEQGVELIIVAAHWGVEGSSRPNSEQEDLGRKLIDLGVDIVYGCHPHALQRIEEYNGGVIYYSLGNFCFGGNNYPKDMDSAIVQQQVIRGEDGTVTLGERTIIPVCISSQQPRNDFQPTPYEAGSEDYARVLAKLGVEE